MSDLKVGDLVEYHGQGRVIGVDVGGRWVKLDGKFLAYIPYEDCTKVQAPPEAGEVWVCTNGTRGFFYFNSNDRLTFVTTHGQHFYPEQITVEHGWSKEYV